MSVHPTRLRVPRRVASFVLAGVLGTGLSTITSSLAYAQDQSVKPGMTGDQVKAAWGNPITTRTHGDYTYMYFKNDCLKTCGFEDVVILEKGQVVDAVVRASNHKYEGTSSSPGDRKPGYTKPS